MNTGTASGKKEKSKIFEMILCSPGMVEHCKISLKVTRQNALLLCRLIEIGMLSEKNVLEDEFLGAIPEDASNSFKEIHEEILKRVGLSDFYEKLKLL